MATTPVVKVGTANDVNPANTDSLFTAFTKINNRFANIAEGGVSGVAAGNLPIPPGSDVGDAGIAVSNAGGTFSVYNTGVTKIVAGNNITLQGNIGVGEVTINSTGGTGIQGITINAGNGINASVSTANNVANISIDNTGVTGLVAGTGITLSGNTGNVTINATGGGGGGGSVTSVGIVSDTNMNITASPVTSAGNILVTLSPTLTNLTSVTSTTFTGTLTTPAQPNITSVGQLTSLNVTGAITAGGNVTATNASLGNLVTANFIAGTLTTPAQPNITSVGTLTSLAVTGNASAGNMNAGNLMTANFISGTLTTPAQPNITSVGTLSSLAVTGAVTAASFAGNGSNLSSITGANVTGTVANATYAANAGYATTSGPAVTAQTVTNAAQPNITSLGTLTSLTSTGNIDGLFLNGDGSNIRNLDANYITSGKLTANLISTPFVTINGVPAPLGTTSTPIKANTTSNLTFSNTGNGANSGTLFDGSIPVTVSYNTIGAPSVDGSGAIGTAWPIGITGQADSAVRAQTVSAPNQPAITSVGTLTKLVVNSAESVQLQTDGQDVEVLDSAIVHAIYDPNPEFFTTQFGRSGGTVTTPIALVANDYLARDSVFGFTGTGESDINAVTGYSYAAGIDSQIISIPTGTNTIPTAISLVAGTGLGNTRANGTTSATLNGSTGVFTVPRLGISEAATVASVAQAAWVPIVVNGTTYKLLLGL